MKKFISPGCIILYLGMLISCKKNKTTPNENPAEPSPATVYENYSALKTGNYWIYREYYVIDGTETENNSYDSCYIAKDTIIRGNTFYKLVSVNYRSIQYLRDSLHYTIDSDGKILFSSKKFNQVINTNYYVLNGDSLNKNDTLFKMELSMLDTNPITTVPAGTFNAFDAVLKISNVHYAPSTSTLYPMYNHSKYARNVGMIYSLQNFASGNAALVKKLLRYHLQN